MALGHDKRDQSKPSAVTNLSKETELSHNTVSPSWHKHIVAGCWVSSGNVSPLFYLVSR
jgi:hypothetical protein